MQYNYTYAQKFKVSNSIIAFNDLLKNNYIHAAFFPSSWGYIKTVMSL